MALLLEVSLVLAIAQQDCINSRVVDDREAGEDDVTQQGTENGDWNRIIDLIHTTRLEDLHRDTEIVATDTTTRTHELRLEEYIQDGRKELAEPEEDQCHTVEKSDLTNVLEEKVEGLDASSAEVLVTRDNDDVGVLGEVAETLL